MGHELRFTSNYDLGNGALKSAVIWGGVGVSRSRIIDLLEGTFLPGDYDVIL